MTVNEFLEKYKRELIPGLLAPWPYLVCNDGFKVSVQASHIHYCTPKDDVGPYFKVEVGFPSQATEEFEPYRSGFSMVFGYVPVEIVEAVIEKHGGIKED